MLTLNVCRMRCRDGEQYKQITILLQEEKEEKLINVMNARTQTNQLHRLFRFIYYSFLITSSKSHVNLVSIWSIWSDYKCFPEYSLLRLIQFFPLQLFKKNVEIGSLKMVFVAISKTEKGCK